MYIIIFFLFILRWMSALLPLLLLFNGTKVRKNQFKRRNRCFILMYSNEKKNEQLNISSLTQNKNAEKCKAISIHSLLLDDLFALM